MTPKFGALLNGLNFYCWGDVVGVHICANFSALITVDYSCVEAGSVRCEKIR